MRLKEDYDFTLQHIEDAGGSVTFNKYLASWQHYSNKGGAVSYRTAQVEQETIKYLLNKWPNCIQLNPKRKNEILLKRNLNQILCSNQTSLF